MPGTIGPLAAGVRLPAALIWVEAWLASAPVAIDGLAHQGLAVANGIVFVLGFVMISTGYS